MTLSIETTSQPAKNGDNYSELLTLIAHLGSTSRVELAQLTGLSRATVAQRIERILKVGLIVEIGNGKSTGGRRPSMISLNPGAGVVIGIDLGASHCHVAIADLKGEVKAIRTIGVVLSDGPLIVLGAVLIVINELLIECLHTKDDVLAIGMGVPGPVDFARGMIVKPPIMPRWDEFVVSQFFESHFKAPTIIDNDVNLMALGEFADRGRPDESMLFVKVGTGIGCGIISHGDIHRGMDGAAGDIGHIQVPENEDVVCVCGNVGCLEAVASGSAMVRRLRSFGKEVESSEDLVRLGIEGDADVVHQIRTAGSQIGAVLAALVSFFNPETIVIGGSISALGDDLLAAIRGVVYLRVLPLATRSLRLELSRSGWKAGIRGAVRLAQHAVLSPDHVNRWMSRPTVG